MQLKQFIPKEICLQCDVCCRFHQARTIWVPLFTESEIRYLAEKNILPSLMFTSGTANKKGGRRINLIEQENCFICPCFNPSDSKCKIYQNRPFECQLYPFLLVKDGLRFYLAQDKKCPYLNIIEDNKTKTYTDYLRKEFNKNNIISLLRQNRELFAEYPPADLKLLFSIEL